MGEPSGVVAVDIVNKQLGDYMTMTWKYVKKTSEDKITAVEKNNKVNLPKDLKDLILANNNGRPTLSTFDTKKTKERVLKKLLSYNEDDTENIYDAIDFLQGQKDLFPIGSDPFGNFICLENSNKIVFFNHETNEIEDIANSVTEFMNKLY